jgi:two-component system NtrC family sensor kinase
MELRPLPAALVNGERASLRLRLLAIVLAAALIPLAPFSIVLLLQIRDGIYGRAIAGARARLADLSDRCTAQACPEAAGVRRVSAACKVRTAREGEELLLCEDVPGGALELREDLRPIRDQLSTLVRRILGALALFVILLVVIAVWLLERGIGRRLERVDVALEGVGAEQGGAALLPEGGDAVGRVGAAVNRLAQRLREERARTRSQIEELEAANQKLREAREDLARSERLASVGRLAAGVAHEVGNPVSALIGYAALMREKLLQGKDVSGYAERVEREATRIDRILRDLLDLARPRAPLRPVDLRTAVAVARASVAPQHPHVAFETALPGGLPPVRGEEHYLAQVFVNLMTNAARAGASRVRVSGRVADGAVLVEVEDDGSGIPADALPRLFEPFFTTAAPGHGSGLGLALCHATLERFGGAIAARNRDGARGVVFELRFLSESAPAAA